MIRIFYYSVFSIMFSFCASFFHAQENAAPSMHINCYFPSEDALLKMQKIKIEQTAMATYFEVNRFTNGYAGLQQTPDKSLGSSNILISSLWDANTAQGIFSSVEYTDSTTLKSRFGGEGDGWKSIQPYNWEVNKWYNIVIRSWKTEGKLFVATFIQDESTEKWFHTATFSIPDPHKYLGATNDAFLENWDGRNATKDGRNIRKACIKNSWNLNLEGVWEKNTHAYFWANDSPADIRRNGMYHNSFNAFYDEKEDAYCYQHGGETTPSKEFNGGRTLKLPPQTHQGVSPQLSVGNLTHVEASYTLGELNIRWKVDEKKSPQLSSIVEIKDKDNLPVVIFQDTLPQRRNLIWKENLPKGKYKAEVRIVDIFNQTSAPISVKFKVKRK